MSNTATVGYKWGKKGKQPQVPCKQSKKERLTLFGSYNYESGQMSADFAEKGNSRTFKKHLKKIRSTYKGRSKIIMVLDNVRFHHARYVQEWLSGQDQLELFFLPPYSPDLNAVEKAWWYMRKKITHNRYVRTMKERKALFWKMFSHFEKPNEELKNVCVVNY